MIYKALVAFFMISILVVPPLAHADVLTLKTDKQVYDRTDKIRFLGTSDGGVQQVTLIIRDSSGDKVEMYTAYSDADSDFEIKMPKSIRHVFDDPGVYEISAFTSKQAVASAISINLQFDKSQVKVVKVYDLELEPIKNKVIDEGKKYSFTARISDNTITDEKYRLGVNTPEGAKIDSKTGKFTWTPTEAQGPGSYLIEIIVTAGISQVKETITITVNETQDPIITKTPPKTVQNTLASFVDPNQDPQHYVDRYNNEKAYKQWFDANFAQYSTIYQAVGLPEPFKLASFVDPNQDPQHYVDRYNNEKAYKQWFDANFAQYSTIYQAVGLPEPDIGICGDGTNLIDGVCTVVKTSFEKPTPPQPTVQEEPQTCFLLWCW